VASSPKQYSKHETPWHTGHKGAKSRKFIRWPEGVRYAYDMVWNYCAAQRRDWWTQDMELAESIAHDYHISLETVQEAIENAVAIGCFVRTRQRVLYVDGVRRKHPGLRGWCPEFDPGTGPEPSQKPLSRKTGTGTGIGTGT